MSQKTAKALHRHISANNGLGLYEDRPMPIVDARGNILTDSFGEMRTAMVSVLVDRRPIAGARMLSTRSANASAIIYRAALNLEKLNFPSEDVVAEASVQWGFDGMGSARKDLMESWKLLSEALRFCGDVQAFLSESSLKTL